MPNRIEEKVAQLHPLRRALKKAWRKLVVAHEVKQLYLARSCDTDESRVSRWLNPDLPDFPPTDQMVKLIEALQEWPGIERWEPLEEWNAYFGCEVAALHRAKAPILELASLVAGETGKLLQQILQAQSPDSPGGTEIVTSEKWDLKPHVAKLRRLFDEWDDALTEDLSMGKGMSA